MIGFIIYSMVFFVLVAIGISSWKTKETVGFFTGVKPPEIPEKNVKKYNHAVAIIWFVFAVIYELLGIPLLLLEQNSPYFIVTILGAMFWVIGLFTAYLTVQKRYMKG